MGKPLYMAYDGDDAGKLVGRAILADDADSLHDASSRINAGHQVVRIWVEAHEGQVVSGGGDEGVFIVPEEATHNLEELRKDYQFTTGLTMTIGVGKSLSEAGKSLMVGKFRGKDTVVVYDLTIEDELNDFKAHIEQGTASQEEKKISEEYFKAEGNDMNKDEKTQGTSHEGCPFCETMVQEGAMDEQCPFCAADAAHDPNAADHPADCPLCQQNAAHDPSAPGHPADCPLCQADEKDGVMGDELQRPDDQAVNPTAGPNTELPTTTSSQDFAGQDLDSPQLPKPDAIQENPDEVVATPEYETNNNVAIEANFDPNAPADKDDVIAPSDGAVSAQSVLDDVDALPATEAQAKQQAGEANTDGVGDGMDDNVSVAGDFLSDTPGDMGLGDDTGTAPDMTSVLQEGLNGQADSIQRERVIQLVAEALEGFKGCKDIIERAKMQAPQLYESSIAMLKAMIEMAKMMGLDQEAQQHVQDPGMQGDSLDASPEYEPHPEKAGTNGLAAPTTDGGSTPDYEAHPEKAAPEGGDVLPKDQGQLAKP